MQSLIAPFVASIAVVLGGCAASTVTLNASPADGQRLTYTRGEPSVTSVLRHAVVLRLFTDVATPGKAAEFGLAVLNRGLTDVEISTDNVSASMNGAPLKVPSYEEMLADEKGNQSSRRFWLGIQAMGAGFSGDPRQQALAKMDGEQFNAASQATVDRMGRTLLRRQTVAPNTAYAGLVRVQLPASVDRSERLSIVVSVPPDEHRFTIEIRPTSGR